MKIPNFKNLLLSGLLSGLGSFGYAQHHSCGTVNPDQHLANHPEAIADYHAFENYLYNFAQQHRANKTQGDNNSEYIIPVVVHVIHNNGTEKISEAQIESQMKALFYDYRAVPGYYSTQLGWDSGIEFALATKDPAGNPTTGINYLQNATLTDHDKDTEESALKSASRWDPTKYLNIYIVKSITSSSQPGSVILGYATFPTFTTNSLDGLVIVGSYFGSRKIHPTGVYANTNIYGRTATHEAGHWLSLYHTFQGACGTTSCTNSGDQVCDTPPTFENNFLSPVRQNTCNNDSPDKLDNTKNYMDYLDDQYLDYMSYGQRARVWGTLNSATLTRRYNLWQDNNHFQTGVGRYKKPEANFSADNRNTVVGAPVTLQPYCMGAPDEFQWSFTNGTNTVTGTGANPTVTFPAYGYYNATLICKTNVAGQPVLADTLTKIGFIFVDSVRTTFPLTQGWDTFTGGSGIPPKGWEYGNVDSAHAVKGLTWLRSATASGFGMSTASAKLEFYKYPNQGQRDRLVSPAINPSGRQNLTLKFSYAYSPLDFQAPSGTPTQYDTQVNDTLIVAVSQDGGNTWTELWRKGGNNLSTVTTPKTDDWVPTSTEWKAETIDLTSYKNTNFLKVKFEGINAWGNNVYIDDFELVDLTAKDQLLSNSDLFIAPNPNTGNSTLFVQLNAAQSLNYTITDIQGKEIYHSEKLNLGVGTHQLPISVQVSEGLYLINVQVGQEIYTRKLMISK